MLNDPLSKLIDKYGSQPVFVDTNLLLLLLVGWIDPKHIQRFKRTKQYSEDDFELLYQLVARFKGVMTCPQVLAEVDNLAKSLTGPLLDDFREELKRRVLHWSEKVQLAQATVADTIYDWAGYSDAAIGLISKQERPLVLTDDMALREYLRREGCAALGIEDLRRAANG